MRRSRNCSLIFIPMVALSLVTLEGLEFPVRETADAATELAIRAAAAAAGRPPTGDEDGFAAELDDCSGLLVNGGMAVAFWAAEERDM